MMERSLIDCSLAFGYDLWEKCPFWLQKKVTFFTIGTGLEPLKKRDNSEGHSGGDYSVFEEIEEELKMPTNECNSRGFQNPHFSY
jgi:hypothetical protein